MTIDVDAVRNWAFPTLRQAYSERETILYALALGYGTHYTDANELRYVYEHDLVAVPTMATSLCHPGFWINDSRTGIDARKAVHAEQKTVWHRPLRAQGVLTGASRVVGIVDRGKDRGALLIVKRDLFDEETGELVVSLEQVTMCRGDGGFTGEQASSRKAADMSPRSPRPAASAPDHIVDIQVLPQAALIYRLCADRNPLHASPAVARDAGFPRPILHGLCTYGLAARAIIQACYGQDAAALGGLSGRFTAPVYPGETLRTEIWEERGSVRFSCSVPSRSVTVFSDGVAERRN
jgi:acyl dehydratase